MPGVDGFEATRRIRALPGGRAGVPVIAITANAMVGDEQRCRGAGMDDYVSKPIDRARLLAKVAEWGPGRRACRMIRPWVAQQNRTNPACSGARPWIMLPTVGHAADPANDGAEPSWGRGRNRTAVGGARSSP